MKRISLMFSAALIQVSLFAQIPTAGLVGYWPMDGNALDYSGNNNNGTVYSATLCNDRFGNPNMAYSFNGVNASIVVNNSPTVDMYNTDFSVCFWVRTYSNPNMDGVPVGKNVYGSWSGYQFMTNCTNAGYCTAPGNLTFYTAAGAWQDACADNSICTGTEGDNGLMEWYFVVGTYDKALNKAYLYVNAVLQADVGAASGNLSNSNNLVFGAHPNNILFFKGALDGVRIYKTKLNQGDINALYNEANSPLGINEKNEPASLVELYPNPNNGTFNLKIKDHVENGELVLFNTLGQKVAVQEINEQDTEISVGGLSQGIYSYKLSVNKKQPVTGKLVIQ